MEKYLRICEQLHNLTFAPLLLFTGEEQILHTWPQVSEGHLSSGGLHLVLEDFCLQRRDPRHPLISYVEPGYFLGIAELEPKLFVMIGPVSPIVHSRREILSMCVEVISPSNLQTYSDMMIQMPTMNLFQVRDLICVLTQMAQGEELPPENILFNDFTLCSSNNSQKVKKALFDQREEETFHVPTDFETFVCGAIETGNMELLLRRLYAPIRGHVGRMSFSELRQEKYSLICLATLISRAAIRGGLPAETAFNLTDIYCQRADLLTEVQAVEQISFAMMLDFCEKVREVRNKAAVSPVIQHCLDYISVHLHEPLGLEKLSSHCGLCGRSLSLRFKKEVGVGIPEYIHREKIQEAKYLLRNTNYSLSQISAYLNYPSQSYFTQIFKRYSDMTPQQYRDAPGIRDLL